MSRQSVDVTFKNPLTIDWKGGVVISHALTEILNLLKNMAQELADLKAQVARVQTVDQSASALLKGIKTSLDAAIRTGDLAEVKKFSDSLGTSSDELCGAILANTPSEP